MNVYIRRSRSRFDHRAFAHDVIANRLYIPGWEALLTMKDIRVGLFTPAAIWAARDEFGINHGWLLADTENQLSGRDYEDVMVMMFVRQKHRRKGLGKALMAQCQKHFPKRTIGGFRGTDGGQAFYDTNEIPWH